MSVDNEKKEESFAHTLYVQETQKQYGDKKNPVNKNIHDKEYVEWLEQRIVKNETLVIKVEEYINLKKTEASYETLKEFTHKLLDSIK